MEKEKRKGLIIVHTGNGKGKTTAAMGLALRSIGYNFKILMIQFIKGAWHYGELDAINKLHPYFEIIPLGKGFIGLGKTEPDAKHVRAAIDAWNFCKEKMISDKFDMIILDEINYVIEYNFIPVEEVLKTLRSKPDKLHLVLTGRNAHPMIIEMADLVTEMKEVKHPFQKGIKAQKGIEF
jgi:cob(I)alamin adenosyltransferase